jgi:hypothetical protein
VSSARGSRETVREIQRYRGREKDSEKEIYREGEHRAVHMIVQV